MNENSVDNSNQVGYNVVNDENVEVVKMDEQRPVNDTECRHPNLIPDPTDTIGEAIYHGCANLECGVGFYITPNTK
jgi:antirestriction protein